MSSAVWSNGTAKMVLPRRRSSSDSLEIDYKLLSLISGENFAKGYSVKGEVWSFTGDFKISDELLLSSFISVCELIFCGVIELFFCMA